MTRKRVRENLGRYLCTPCPYCEGKTRIKSAATTVYEIYREIIRISKSNPACQNILLGVHPDIGEYIEDEESKAFKSMEKIINGNITLQLSDKFHLEQFEILEL